ncbi:MAG: TIGR04076 family protein [Candidatus Thorarchaeota archaeon]
MVSLPVKVRIEVIDILGTGECSMGQKIGEVYNYPEDRGKMCPSSFYSLIPWIMVMQSGGKYSFFKDDGNSVTLGCPDFTHQVVYKVIREIVDD